MTVSKHKPVTVVDPDLPVRTLVAAWEQGEDKATGHRLVVIDSEPGALRRIKPEDVYPALRPVPKP